MTALKCFNELETRRLYEILINLKKDEVSKKSVAFKFVTNFIKVLGYFEERAKKTLLSGSYSDICFWKSNETISLIFSLNVVRC